MGGCWRRGLAPNHAVEDGWGHEGAVEEGCVRHAAEVDCGLSTKGSKAWKKPIEEQE